MIMSEIGCQSFLKCIQAMPEEEALGDQRRDLKKKRGKPEGAKDYREIKRKIRTEMKMEKETGSMPGSGSMPQKE